MGEFVNVAPDAVRLTYSPPPPLDNIISNADRLPDTYLVDLRGMFQKSANILNDPSINTVNTLYSHLSTYGGPLPGFLGGVKLLFLAAGIGAVSGAKGVLFGPHKAAWLEYFNQSISDIDFLISLRSEFPDDVNHDGAPRNDHFEVLLRGVNSLTGNDFIL